MLCFLLHYIHLLHQRLKFLSRWITRIIDYFLPISHRLFKLYIRLVFSQIVYSLYLCFTLQFHHTCTSILFLSWLSLVLFLQFFQIANPKFAWIDIRLIFYHNTAIFQHSLPFILIQRKLKIQNTLFQLRLLLLIHCRLMLFFNFATVIPQSFPDTIFFHFDGVIESRFYILMISSMVQFFQLLL